jgi:hypothetical protein
MSTLTDLNNYASGNVEFTITTVEFDRGSGNTFQSPLISWVPVSQLGNLTGNSVQIQYDMWANTTVSFPNAGDAQETLIIANPSAGVYTIKGIRTFVDYNASLATVTPPAGYAGNVPYQVTYTNTNNAAGEANFVVDYVGVP